NWIWYYHIKILIVARVIIVVAMIKKQRNRSQKSLPVVDFQLFFYYDSPIRLTDNIIMTISLIHTESPPVPERNG
ncbi:TPA: hypothetical protein ACLFL7_005123, partial [Salmonella enterica subsp. diarizonae serovar 53:z10:z35]